MTTPLNKTQNISPPSQEYTPILKWPIPFISAKELIDKAKKCGNASAIAGELIALERRLAHLDEALRDLADELELDGKLKKITSSLIDFLRDWTDTEEYTDEEPSEDEDEADWVSQPVSSKL